jgi:predicted AAA+ superfamily ATPase
MPHHRDRFILPIVVKRVKSSPVTTIQGARQTGKSFLVRELLKKSFSKLEYRTFDSAIEQRFAFTNPEVYLRSQEALPFVIDEAQKVPQIFDAVKLIVDEARKPAQFILTGSTEFSHKSKIRESLTGRMTSVRIFPLSTSESIQLPFEAFRWNFTSKLKPRIGKSELLRYLACGGLPGIFSVRNSETRNQYLSDWLELTWSRDIHQIKSSGADSSLCRDILFSLASVEVPDIYNVAKQLRFSTRAIQKQINILETLFVLNRIQPHRLGAGKDRYFIFDVITRNLHWY